MKGLFLPLTKYWSCLLRILQMTAEGFNQEILADDLGRKFCKTFLLKLMKVL